MPLLMHSTTWQVSNTVDAILRATSATTKSDVKAWENELVSCNHIADLAQSPEAKTVEQGMLAEGATCSVLF